MFGIERGAKVIRDHLFKEVNHWRICSSDQRLGKMQTLTSNETAEHSANNRRVEILVEGYRPKLSLLY